jgi:hypothetical protein
MRSRIMVISRDAALRARLAQLLTRRGYRPEVAESAAHARRAGLDGIALAILAPDGLGEEHAAAVEELRAAVGRALIVAPAGAGAAYPDCIDASDEMDLLARVAEVLAPKPEPEATEPTFEFAGYRVEAAQERVDVVAAAPDRPPRVSRPSLPAHDGVSKGVLLPPASKEGGSQRAAATRARAGRIKKLAENQPARQPHDRARNRFTTRKQGRSRPSQMGGKRA